MLEKNLFDHDTSPHFFQVRQRKHRCQPLAIGISDGFISSEFLTRLRRVSDGQALLKRIFHARITDASL